MNITQNYVIKLQNLQNCIENGHLCVDNIKFKKWVQRTLRLKKPFRISENITDTNTVFMNKPVIDNIKFILIRIKVTRLA